MTSPNKTLLTILMVISMTAWGGSWVSAKLIANLASPETLIFWRFTVTFLTTFPLMFMFKESAQLSKRNLLQTLLASALMVLYNKFFFWGLTYGFAGAGGVLVTTLNPVLTFFISSWAFRRKVLKIEIAGLFLGCVGGLILLHIWQVDFRKLLLSGNLFFLICSLSWAILGTVSEKAKADISPLKFSFYVYGFAALLDLFMANPSEVIHALDYNFLFWFNIFYLAVIATTFATTVYFLTTTKWGAHIASSFIFLVPVSAVLLSWIILDEKPLWTTILGGSVAILAVYTINFGRRLIDKIRMRNIL